MSDAAADRLLELARLLRACGDERAPWLEEQALCVRTGEPGAIATPPVPPPSAGKSAAEARDEVWGVIEAFDHAL